MGRALRGLQQAFKAALNNLEWPPRVIDLGQPSKTATRAGAFA